ncbi:MAG: hypothetical protein JWM18_3199 [Chloroflexi bacterium]|jgi:hypothetical protein|nr:hypothetical protein [Chloroflexota bacterium]
MRKFAVVVAGLAVAAGISIGAVEYHVQATTVTAPVSNPAPYQVPDSPYQRQAGPIRSF